MADKMKKLYSSELDCWRKTKQLPERQIGSTNQGGTRLETFYVKKMMWYCYKNLKW